METKIGTWRRETKSPMTYDSSEEIQLIYALERNRYICGLLITHKQLLELIWRAFKNSVKTKSPKSKRDE
jgi:hypothetical protein